MDGRPLTFHLAGINNQNFLMRDEETGSFWQQISGIAVSGPLKGRQLELVHSDELSFGLWRQEHPDGTVLKPVAASANQYEDKDWEKAMGRMRTVVDTTATGRPPRELLFGLTHGGRSRAYPVDRVLAEKLVLDQGVMLAVGPDGRSVRAFAVDSDFYRQPETGVLIAAATGSTWNFRGCTAEGRCLKPVPMLKDYWFDWQRYHPDTTVFQR